MNTSDTEQRTVGPHDAGVHEVRLSEPWWIPGVPTSSPPAGRPPATPPVARRVTTLGFVFPDGRVLSPTEIAALRIFAAAGMRPRCVVAGSDRAPDAELFRAGLRYRPAPRSTANPNRDQSETG